MERRFCQTLRQLSSLAAAFTFTLTGNAAFAAAPPCSRSTSGPLVLFILYLSPPPALVLQLIYSLAETSPWIIEMNDSAISLRIHITCHSREREKEKENVIKRWSGKGAGGWWWCVSVLVCVCAGVGWWGGTKQNQTKPKLNHLEPPAQLIGWIKALRTSWIQTENHDSIITDTT